MRLCWIVLFGVTACSPYNFSPEVTGFSSGVDKVAQGFAATDTALATDRETEVELKLTDTRARVVKSPSCEVPVSKGVAGSAAPCELYRQGGTATQPSAVEIRLVKTRAALMALQNYARALAAVTNAADRSAFDAAVGKLGSSLGAMAAAAGPQGAAAGKGVTAGFDMIGWLVGEELDDQRFDALKQAVNAVGTAPDGGETAMKVVTNAIGQGLVLARDTRLTSLNEELDIDMARLGPGLGDAAYTQRLANSEALANSIEALRTADPAGTAAQINTAHEALVKAVNDPSRELPSLLTALEQFTGKAEALDGAFTASAAPKAAAAKPKPATAKSGS
jgi:hypothetical protein